MSASAVASMRAIISTALLNTTAASRWLVSSFQTGVDPKGKKRLEYQGERQTNARTRLNGAVMAAVSLQLMGADRLSTKPSIAPSGIHDARYRMNRVRLERSGCIAGQRPGSAQFWMLTPPNTAYPVTKSRGAVTPSVGLGGTVLSS